MSNVLPTHMSSTLCVIAMMVNGTKERERALEHSTMPSKALYCKFHKFIQVYVCGFITFFQWFQVHWRVVPRLEARERPVCLSEWASV